MKYYHVITQSYKGKNVFPTEEDCLVYLQLVKAACHQYDVAWISYAVMPTHTHLILAVDQNAVARLTKARHKITCGYVAYARKKFPELCAGDNRIFCRKNTAKVLQTAYDVKTCICYLHRNPLNKALETTIGETVRSSYCAMLSLLEPENQENPFLRFIELREIRDGLALEDACRFFGRNRNEQRQVFLSSHATALQEGLPTATVGMDQALVQKAESILQNTFLQVHAFGGKPFDAENRQAFLYWINRRGNVYRTSIILQLHDNLSLSTRDIATLLNTSSTTVKRIISRYRNDC